MSKQPLVSVIVPVYNGSAYLDRCVKSILGQTYTNLEIWLIDDGSTDNSLALCRQFARQDGRVHVVHQPNQGNCAARNTGIEHATGDFLALIDQDDWLPENAYQTLLDLHVRTGAEVVWGNITYYQEGKDPFTPIRLFSNRERKKLSLEQVLYVHVPYCWDKLYARRLITQGLRFNPALALGEDVDFFFRAAKESNFVAFTPTPVYCYFLHKASLSHQPSISRCESSVKVYQQIYRFCQAKQWHRAQQIYLSLVVSNVCLLLMTLLLYDLSNQYNPSFQTACKLLRQHTRALLTNPHMGVAGRLFMFFPMYFPKTARWLFRRPWLLPRLQKQYACRLVHNPQERDEITVCPKII